MYANNPSSCRSSKRYRIDPIINVRCLRVLQAMLSADAWAHQALCNCPLLTFVNLLQAPPSEELPRLARPFHEAGVSALARKRQRTPSRDPRKERL